MLIDSFAHCLDWEATVGAKSEVEGEEDAMGIFEPRRRGAEEEEVSAEGVSLTVSTGLVG